MSKSFSLVLAVCFSTSISLLAQKQTTYGGVNITGQLVLARTVNLSAQAQLQAQSSPSASVQASLFGINSLSPVRRGIESEVPPSLRHNFPAISRLGLISSESNSSIPAAREMAVAHASTSSGFPGITHFDQRNANGGNQFSVEPPSPGLAVGNGYVVEGVNNAIQVYSTSGTPLLPTVVSTNQLFGVSPAINRSTGANGVFPTDMRVFYDPPVNRWFVLQRVLANDIFGNPLPQSYYLLAVSQTGDPTATYNIYTFDTTNAASFRCPCVFDYPQIGADQFGFYISANEFNANSSDFALAANILAISKTALAAGAATPTVVKFEIPFVSGYEFTIQPATTPPGASYFLADGGLEYFVSSLMASTDSNLALWAMTNTASLTTASPNLALTTTTVPTLTYSLPNPATQKKGPLTYALTLTPPGLEAELDGGDVRVLSVCYAGGKLYVTLGTQVTDANGHILAGGLYVVISPAFLNGVLYGLVLPGRQGYLVVNNNNLLRPAIAVTAQGNGAIVFTIAGPDYFPSAAFVPFTAFSPASNIQIAGPGALPEDGFTGYPNLGFPVIGIARWGDYSAAVVDGTGSVWMGTEYIPNSPRTPFANWGTYVVQYKP
jgi:hypothetical protein